MTNEELVIQIQKGQKDLLAELWEQVRRFIVKRARMFTLYHDGNNKLDEEDLVQSGYLALLETIRTFNPEAECSFIGYLNLRLKTQFLIEAGIRTSRRDALTMARSLDEPISSNDGDDEGKSALVDFIPSPNDEIEDTIDRLVNEQFISTVFTCMKRLEPKVHDILSQIYVKQKQCQEIAEEYKITSQRVGQIRNRGLRLLRGMPEIRKIINEYYMDMHTSFYKHKGYRNFNSSFSSVVEDLIIWREKQREEMEKKMEAIIVRSV